MFFAALLAFLAAAALAARLALREWWSCAAFAAVTLLAFGRIATLPFFGDVSAFLDVPGFSGDGKTDIILACVLFTLLGAMIVAGAVVAPARWIWLRSQRRHVGDP